MIKINRPTVSDALKKIGRKETRKNCKHYDQYPKLYISGEKKFKFNQSILIRSGLKDALFKAQHEKCCYCETKLPKNSDDKSLEHFRPKSSTKQKKREPEKCPGYYWLAYCQDNLLISCSQCNTRKGSLFPLVNPKKRARSHHDDVDMESPLFVDPAYDNPRQHIMFREAAVAPCTKKGLQTIEGIDLKRDVLEEDRIERLQKLKTFHDSLNALKSDDSTCARRLKCRLIRRLKTAVRPRAKYSAMAMDYFLRLKTDQSSLQ